MGFLRLLESIRIPALNVFFSGITYCGDEIAFMVVAFALFWCVNKRTGYYAFLVGLFGTVGNQWLKIACRIPRPWVLDPDFTIVESARAAATGYSFPSGHTQNAVGTFGAMALRTERKWVRGVCIALIGVVTVIWGLQSPMTLWGVDPQLFVVGTIGGLGLILIAVAFAWAIVKLVQEAKAERKASESADGAADPHDSRASMRQSAE